MAHGGARPGAGRPVRPKVVLGDCQDPESLLRAVLRNDACSPELRVRAAAILLQREMSVERFKAQFVCGEEA